MKKAGAVTSGTAFLVTPSPSTALRACPEGIEGINSVEGSGVEREARAFRGRISRLKIR
jgi:hypothetical protein